MSACNGNKSSEGLGDDADGRLRKASVIAKSFVEDKMGECDFEDLDYRGEETSVNNRFRVLQKFTHNGEQYVYRIYIQYFGGVGDDWADRSNWSYGQLTVESTMTGQQLHYHGNMKERAASVMQEQNALGIDAAGYHFEIAEQNDNVIRIYDNNKLPLDEIKKVVIDMRKAKKWDIIQFAKTGKTERGQEYATWQNNSIFDFENDKIINFNPDK